MSYDFGKVYVKKKPCLHEQAVYDGNSDWPGLVCKFCGEKIADSQEKYYEESK